MKRRFIRSAFLLILILSVCVTATVVERTVRKELSDSVSVANEVSVKSDPIQQFRTEREQLRQMQKNELNEIIYTQNADEGIVRDAQEQLLDLLETERLEVLTEGILHLRGFEGAVVILNGESANVLIGEEILDVQKSTLIMELIVSETGVSTGNVKIIPIN